MEDKKQKKLIITLLLVSVLIVMIVGTTFAYFAAQLGSGSNTVANLQSGTTDELTFKEGTPIALSLSLDNFSEGSGNVGGSTIAQATLLANNKTNTATMGYNVYYIIDSNTFIYTTDEEKAEIVLKVTDPTGAEVTSITGLKKTELGFDITNKTGSFLIAKNYEIMASPTKTDDWKFEIIFVNLDTNQNANMGKTLSGKVFMTTDDVETYKLPEINNATPGTTSNSITVNMDTTAGSKNISKYYYAIVKKGSPAPSDDDYIESTNPTHTFDNLEPDEEYEVYSYVVDEEDNKGVVYNTTVVTNEYQLPTIASVTKTSNELTSITVSVDASKGEAGISKYYYSKDNGTTYEESNNNTYTFTGLSENTQYNIKVKVMDVNNKYSTEYATNLSTREYSLPVISNVTLNTTYNSITATAASVVGEANISKYLFTIDNWVTSKESNTNTYTFTGLTENKAYTIKVKAVDVNSRESVEKTAAGTTESYVLATVTNVTLTSTVNSVTVTATASNGTGTVATYYYSKDNGVSYFPSSNNTYTFNDLTPGTTYNIKVKVKDNNNRESTEMLKSIATKPYVSPTINNITTIPLSTSISVRVDASAGSGALKTYYYKIGNNSYVSSTSSSYTFSNLSSSTSYTIISYVVDVNGKSSAEKSVVEKTSGVVPELNSVSCSGDQLILNTTPTSGIRVLHGTEFAPMTTISQVGMTTTNSTTLTVGSQSVVAGTTVYLYVTLKYGDQSSAPYLIKKTFFMNTYTCSIDTTSSEGTM